MNTTINRSELGRQLAALRPVRIVRCAVCGIEVLGTSRKQYCSSRCVKKAYYERQRG